MIVMFLYLGSFSRFSPFFVDFKRLTQDILLETFLSFYYLIEITTMQRHTHSFFGQKVGIIFDSADWSEPYIFLRFLKKKAAGGWEKPSQKEGKNIKLNLLEELAIQDVFQGQGEKWSTVHKFGNETTSITVEQKGEEFMIGIPGYVKYFKFPESLLFAKILAHVIEEKIMHATGTSPKVNSEKMTSEIVAESKIDFNSNISIINWEDQTELLEEAPFDFQIPDEFLEDATPLPKIVPRSEKNYETAKEPLITHQEWLQQLPLKEDSYLVPGEILARSPKAIAFQVKGANSTWVPLSCINNDLAQPNDSGLWIKKWFVEKKVNDLFLIA
jgi:hypothetical protein